MNVIRATFYSFLPCRFYGINQKKDVLLTQYLVPFFLFPRIRNSDLNFCVVYVMVHKDFTIFVLYILLAVPGHLQSGECGGGRQSADEFYKQNVLSAKE